MSKLKNDIIVKEYYLIGEIAEILNIPVSTLRFWKYNFYPEFNGRIGSVVRLPRRMLDNFKIIYQLIKIEGYTLKGTKRKLSKLTDKQKGEIVNEFNERNLL
jgi:DNA-binding transcriptional MerR regulator